MESVSPTQVIEFSLGVILFVTGCFAASFMLKRELRSVFTAYAAFFGIVGSFILIRSHVLSVFYHNESFWLHARMITLFALHPAGVWVACQIFPVGYRQIFRVLAWVNVAIGVVLTGVALVATIDLWQLHTLSSYAGGTNILLVFGMACREVLHGNKKVRYFLAGLLCIMITGASDMLVMNGVYKAPLLFQYGSFAMAFSVAMYMGRKLHLAHLLINNIRVLLPPRFFREVLQRPDLLDRPPEQHELTILFVDLVDSTRSIENMGPLDSFRRTSGLLQEVVKVIHEHDGIVEKTLGDGLLGYFGYQADTDAACDHREDALRAATKIQNLNAHKMLVEGEQGITLPLRIGVNTDFVTIGNIGGAERFEISAVGLGVIMAQRFEQSADPFKILAGENTVTRRRDNVADISGYRKHVKIKHRNELVTAYEVNPFEDNPQVFSECCNIHRQRMNRQRMERREGVGGSRAVTCQANTSSGWLVDISLSGIAVSLDKFYARGVAIELVLQTEIPSLASLLADGHMNEFEVMVQWAQEKDGRFVHGCRIVGLNPSLRQKLCDGIVESLGRHDAKSA